MKTRKSLLFRVALVALLFAAVVLALPLSTTFAASTLTAQIQNGGADSTQQSQFHINIVNTSAAAVTNFSARLYITIDGSQAISKYVLEKYYDQSGVVAISGPTQASGSIYYWTLSYGSYSLAAGQSVQYQGALHLNDWTNNFDPTNDWYHTGYATGALPSANTNTNYIPLYVSGTLVWGSVPGGVTASNTPTTGVIASATNTVAPSKTNTPGASLTPSKTNTPVNTLAASNTPTKTQTVVIVPSNTPTKVNTAVASATPSKTLTPGPTATQGQIGSHLANPFAGAVWYHNPDWVAEVNASAVTSSQKSYMASKNTFVWMDSIGSLNGTNGGRGLIGHLDAAVAQGANLIGIVVYDLPNRDCSALASNGELLMANDGFNKYKTQYIDVMVADILSKPAYANLRIVAVIEPDSLPNLLTNLSFPKCQEATGAGGYVDSTRYTLNSLYNLRNVYSYIDIGHAGWLGWDTNFGPAVTLIANAILGTTHGSQSVDGFISNTANTSVQTEPFMTANQSISGNPVRSATFYQWNIYIDESPFDAAWAVAMQGKGFAAANTNMLIDTSRNGWGGCGGGGGGAGNCRPTAASTSTVLDTFVNATRIDRRPGKGDWCNQNGAGVGAPPQANPSSVFQAYVWVKPQGESDGSSTLIPQGPDNPDGKGFDRMCDPTYGGNALNNNMPSGALAGAPVSGRWFEAQFDQLVANAFPAIP